MLTTSETRETHDEIFEECRPPEVDDALPVVSELPYGWRSTDERDPVAGMTEDRLSPDGGGEVVYFWYDPEKNAVVQDRVEPGVYLGVFDQREGAVYFGEHYDEIKDSVDFSDFELYQARLNQLGTGTELLE